MKIQLHSLKPLKEFYRFVVIARKSVMKRMCGRHLISMLETIPMQSSRTAFVRNALKPIMRSFQKMIRTNEEHKMNIVPGVS